MVLAAWRFLHKAERLAVNIIETPYVAARLRRAQAELRELPEEQQRIWEATLKEHTLRAEQQNTLRQTFRVSGQSTGRTEGTPRGAAENLGGNS
jgi:hypothetical protein